MIKYDQQVENQVDKIKELAKPRTSMLANLVSFNDHGDQELHYNINMAHFKKNHNLHNIGLCTTIRYLQLVTIA